jgi:hypothetical protein
LEQERIQIIEDKEHLGNRLREETLASEEQVKAFYSQFYVRTESSYRSFKRSIRQKSHSIRSQRAGKLA